MTDSEQHSSSDLISAALEQLASDTSELWGFKQVQRYKQMPTALEFSRIVRRNVPVVFEGLCADWEATRTWSQQVLEEKLGEKMVSVSVTPNGRADAVTAINVENIRCCVESRPTIEKGNKHEDTSDNTTQRRSFDLLGYGIHKLFVQPEERRMTMRSFFKLLLRQDKNKVDDCGGSGGKCTEIPYVSQQNDSLRQEFPNLIADLPDCIDFAQKVFGNPPDAVNLWIGDERAMTTMHKDHYENM